MRKKVLILLLAVLLLVSFLTVACAPAKRPGPAEQPPAPANPAPNQNNNTNMTNEEGAKANRLAEKISQVKDINSATVVLANTTAWVGVDFKANATLSEGVKTEISNIVKKEEKAIKTVHVTADADTVTRLRNIARDIGNGRPVSGFMDELREIEKRITPSTT